MSIIISPKHLLDGQPYACTIEYNGDPELLQTTDYVVFGLIDPRTMTIYCVGMTENFGQRLKQQCFVSRERSSPQERRKIEIFEAGLHTQVTIFDVTPHQERAAKLKAQKQKEHERTILSNRRPNFY
jgi:hypothetical protein